MSREERDSAEPIFDGREPLIQVLAKTRLCNFLKSSMADGTVPYDDMERMAIIAVGKLQHALARIPTATHPNVGVEKVQITQIPKICDRLGKVWDMGAFHQMT